MNIKYFFTILAGYLVSALLMMTSAMALKTTVSVNVHNMTNNTYDVSIRTSGATTQVAPGLEHKIVPKSEKDHQITFTINGEGRMERPIIRIENAAGKTLTCNIDFTLRWLTGKNRYQVVNTHATQGDKICHLSPSVKDANGHEVIVLSIY